MLVIRRVIREKIEAVRVEVIGKDGHSVVIIYRKIACVYVVGGGGDQRGLNDTRGLKIVSIQ